MIRAKGSWSPDWLRRFKRQIQGSQSPSWYVAVAICPLSQQGENAFRRVWACEKGTSRPLAIAHDPPQNLLRVSSQTEHSAGRLQHFDTRRVEHHSAASRDDQASLGTEFRSYIALHRSKRTLALIGEDFGDRTMTFNDDVVGVDEFGVKGCCQQPPHRGLARAHESGQHHVARRWSRLKSCHAGEPTDANQSVGT